MTCLPCLDADEVAPSDRYPLLAALLHEHCEDRERCQCEHCSHQRKD